MPHHRRQSRRRPAWDAADRPIAIRVGHRRSPTKYHEIQVFSPRDGGRFARLVQDQVQAHPNDPLIISVNGSQPWLEDVLHTCLVEHGSDMADLNRAVQNASTMQFPERASKRGPRDRVPWTFIIDQMNVPNVYYWSVDVDPPSDTDRGLPPMENFRFRTGVWFCGRGAYRDADEVPVAVIFTKSTPVSDHIVRDIMFDYLWRDADLRQPRRDEEGLCWIFSRLYYLLTDWQNIIGEVLARLDEAEANSHGRHLPVKVRTRRMHNEVDRIFELKEYLHFHTRSYKKLQRLKANVPQNEQQDPLWNEIDDAVEDLEQFDSTLDGLKERFNNLIELEFNLTSATNSDNSAFLTAVATLFLPVSFLSGLFGMTSAEWPTIWYVYVAIPVFIASVVFTALFPLARKRLQKVTAPLGDQELRLDEKDFTMLGDDYPSNVSNGNRQGRFKRQAKGVPGAQPVRSLSRRSQKWARERFIGEKDF